MIQLVVCASEWLVVYHDAAASQRHSSRPQRRVMPGSTKELATHSMMHAGNWPHDLKSTTLNSETILCRLLLQD